MEILVESVTPRTRRVDGLVLPVAKGERVAARAAAGGGAFRGPAGALGARKLFEGGAGQVHTLVGAGRGGAGAVTLVGLGEARKVGAEALRRAAAVGVRAARDQGARRVALEVPAGLPASLPVERAVAALAEGALLGLYRWESYRTEKSKTDVERLAFLVPPRQAAAARRGLARGRILAESTRLARDLGNEPSNVATPRWVADKAVEMARAEGLEVRVLEKDEMERLGMGSLLGVSRGSAQPPKLLILAHQPKGRRGADARVPTVALVGKGVTFDTGGISIKPAAKMEDMKFDMCGGAAVIGALRAVARLALPVRVVGIVPLVENMPDGNAYKPGDILKAMNGTTIEVRNTDAEGRLILCDALAYAAKHVKPKPKAIIDAATLTGACVVALADQYAAVLGDDALCAHLTKASAASGEPIWRLPLDDGYRRMMDSPYADLSNLGPPGGGVQQGAAFLERFAGGIPWAHLDIAGMAWTEKDGGLLKKGATGFGVRLLVEALASWGRGPRRA
jgi:leucyl aminopeptidase